MVVLLLRACNLTWKGMEDLKPKPIKAAEQVSGQHGVEVQEHEETGT